MRVWLLGGLQSQQEGVCRYARMDSHMSQSTKLKPSKWVV